MSAAFRGSEVYELSVRKDLSLKRTGGLYAFTGPRSLAVAVYGWCERLHELPLEEAAPAVDIAKEFCTTVPFEDPPRR